MREYSVRFLIAMILGVCVFILFMAGKSEQSASGDGYRIELVSSAAYILYNLR